MNRRVETGKQRRRWAGAAVALTVLVFSVAVIVLGYAPRAEAQGAPGAPGGVGGPPGGGMPGGGMPGMGMPGGGMPGAGAPGGGMPGGGMPGMGMPGAGAVGPGAPGAAPGGAPAVPAAPAKPPLEPWRENPFLPVGVEAAARVPMPWVRTYGPNWYNYPVGIGVVGLPMIERPGPRPTPLPPPAAERFMRVSSIVWTGGQAIASCELPDGRTVVVKPGEFVGEWQVTEILRDRIRVRHRTRGDVQEVFLRPKEKLPELPGGAFGAPGGQLPTPGVVPGGAPPTGAGPAAPAAPGRRLRPGQGG